MNGEGPESTTRGRSDKAFAVEVAQHKARTEAGSSRLVEKSTRGRKRQGQRRVSRQRGPYGPKTVSKKKDEVRDDDRGGGGRTIFREGAGFQSGGGMQ